MAINLGDIEKWWSVGRTVLAVLFGVGSGAVAASTAMTSRDNRLDNIDRFGSAYTREYVNRAEANMAQVKADIADMKGDLRVIRNSLEVRK